MKSINQIIAEYKHVYNDVPGDGEKYYAESVVKRIVIECIYHSQCNDRASEVGVQPEVMPKIIYQLTHYYLQELRDGGWYTIVHDEKYEEIEKSMELFLDEIKGKTCRIIKRTVRKISEEEIVKDNFTA